MGTTTTRRQAARFLLRFGAFVALLLVMCELFFRVVLVARETPYPWQDETFMLQRYDVKGPTSGWFTSGRQVQQKSRWHINAEGWNSAQPYLPAADRDTPMIAILGDSQIDAMYTEWSESLPHQLELLGDARFAVYGFGHSGYKIGQYITVARYLAAKGFEPAVVILFINPGDVSSGVDAFGAKRRSNNTLLAWDARAAVDGGQRFTEQAPTPYRTTGFRRLLRQSAFVRYLVFNARINPLPGKQSDLALGRATRAQEGVEAASDPRYAEAVRHVVRRIRAILPKTTVTFLIDADRYAIYATGRAQPIGISPVISQVCAEEGCGVLDLTETLIRRFAEDGRWFNFDHNPHWNAYGQRVIADAVAGFLRARGDLPSAAPR
ncbi:MAG: lysophospholipase L1-like esterase [Bradymonadia bacterium]|jgi:lysophospholipase L1-like esterase